MIEPQKHAIPLKKKQPVLYNIVNGQVASSSVNVQNGLEVGTAQSTAFNASLPSGFHTKISKRILTLESRKKHATIKGKPVYDMETLFARPFEVGQQLEI